MNNNNIEDCVEFFFNEKVFDKTECQVTLVHRSADVRESEQKDLTPTKSQITKKVIDLLESVCSVSVRTMKVVGEMEDD